MTAVAPETSPAAPADVRTAGVRTAGVRTASVKTAGVQTALVVGGGIAGLATTLALRRVGIEAVALERAPVLREVGAGIALWPNATRALARLGVLDSLTAVSGTLTTVRIATPDGQTLFRVDPSRHATPAFCVERPTLVAALMSALPESAVEFGRAVASVEDDGAGVRVRFADGTEATADLLVGADGLRSVVRRAVCGDTPPAFCGQTVARGIGPLLPPLAPGDAVEVWGDGLRVGVFDVGGGRAYWYLVETRAEAETGPVTTAEHAAWLDRLAGWHAPLRDTVAATPPERIARHAVFDRPPQRPWSRGRTVLVGDAAHAMTPDLGQGGAMALEDAVALAEALAASASVAEALAVYERVRAPRAAWIARQSRWSGRLGQAGGVAGRVRNRVSRMVPSRAFAAGFAWPFA